MATYSETILADNPVGYWKLDETSGTVAADSSTNSNNGTIAGTPTMGANGLVFEPSGKCIDFDGVNDEVSIGTAFEATVDSSASIAFETWFSSTNNSATNQNMFILPQDTNGTGFVVALESGKARIRARPEGVDVLEDTYTTASAFADGNSHHLVAVCDFANRSWFIYIDGVSQALDQLAPASWTTLYYNVISPDGGLLTRFGSNLDATASDFTGKIQHIAIYDKALTPLQIRKHYQAGIAQGFHKEVLALNPTAYYPLNEASGDAIDWSGNDDNGTLNGGVTQGATGALAYDDSTAYSFDGAGDYISVLTPSGLLANDTKTIGGWFTMPPALDAYGLMATRSDLGGVDNSMKGYGFDVQADGSIRYFHTAVGTAQTAAGVVAVDENYFIAVTTGLNGASATLYVNGVSISWSTNTLTTAVAETANGYTVIGVQSISHFKGVIQSTLLKDAALTPAQIRTLYQSGKTLIESRGYPKVIQNLSPTGYWRLGEASGTMAFDESGNDNDGTINGSPVMATNDGALHQSKLKAMTFDGVDDEVATTYAGVLGSSPRTICAWVKPNAIGTVEYFTSAGENVAGKLNNLRVNADGTLGVAYNSGYADGDTVMIADTFYLLAYTLGGTTIGDTLLYVNGVSQSITFLNSGSTVNTGSVFSFSIGYTEALADYMACDIGEVAYFDSALTAQQIKQIYEAGKSRYAAEVISYQPTGYWRGTDPSGSVTDYGSGGSDGTLNGDASLGFASSPLSNETVPTTSMDFDGGGDHVECNGGVLTGDMSSTMLIFMNCDTVNSDNTAAFAQRSTVYDSQIGIGVGIDNSTSSEWANDTDENFYKTSTIDMPTTEWHMLGGTFDTSDGTNTTYYDGVANTSRTDAAMVGKTFVSSSKLRIGASYDTSTIQELNGQLAEAALFQTTLTAPQILDIYEMASYSAREVQLFLETVTESMLTTDEDPATLKVVIKVITEALSTTDITPTAIKATLRSIVESFALSGEVLSAVNSLITSINESMTTSSSTSDNARVSSILAELVASSDTYSTNTITSGTIDDTLNALADVLLSFDVAILDSLTGDVSVSYQEVYDRLLSDYFTSTGYTSNTANLKNTIQDVITVESIQRLVFFIEAIESITSTNILDLSRESRSSISDILIASPELGSVLTANGTSVLENLVASGNTDRFFLALLLESLNVSSTLLQSIVSRALLVEGIDISDNLVDQLLKSITADDTLSILSGASTSAILTAKLDGYVTFTIDDPDTDSSYYGWTYNPENKAVTNYDLNFSELTRYKNDFYLANSAGLYLFDGNQDEGSYIQSKITTAGMTFGKHTEKQIPQVFLGVGGTNHIISVSVDQRDTVYYELKGWSDDQLAGKTLSVGKGLIGNTWQFSITDVDQLTFDLNTLEFYPVFLQRKHR